MPAVPSRRSRDDLWATISSGTQLVASGSGMSVADCTLMPSRSYIEAWRPRKVAPEWHLGKAIRTNTLLDGLQRLNCQDYHSR